MAWGSSKAPVWTDADTALWHTCRILDACATDSLEPVATVFPLAPGEVAIVDGVFRADEYTAGGDGTYYRSGTFAFGRPSLVAGVLLANAASNAAARRRAQADAEVRWRPSFDGNLTVTTHGFVLHTTGGVHRWDWESVDFMQLEDRSQLILQGRSEQGPIAWRFHTWWAELLLYLWAAVRHPGHPQLAGGSWLPDGWIDHARQHGYPPALGWSGATAS